MGARKVGPKKRRGNGGKPPEQHQFKVGNPGGPGRPPLPPDLKEALKANALPLYERGLKMMEDAQAAGDLSTASKLLLGLLKKSLPDAVDVKLSGDAEAPVVIREVSDVRATLFARLAALAAPREEGGDSGPGTDQPP